ncbi:class I SAM-dependent methyltransferase [Facklamia sp. 7083-14-GEN3]|uniref:tRNA (mnm(5)s(2)U34)-methyltransferase n=1 Tax=Facklamia sp. 7083-14-GEN3 TaxID=2973478 RepID=UPI00215C2578|nr:class I SAM-dependent methyltransferase [Facklamia sp. 7083-14-GEN3]MCR8969225.1 class I SAM-dependent methyltransferase [Facklamia sp. 7083-14-GEN3]
MKNALQSSHDALGKLIERFPTGNYIDATLGKGRDSYFILSHPSFAGKLFAFDIQDQALQLAQQKLKDFPSDSFQLFNNGHEHFNQILSLSTLPKIHGAIFNLGYLPGANHQITTKALTTLQALNQMAQRLVSKGKIFIVVYSGHAEGAIEKEELLEELRKWSQDQFSISILDFLNQKNHPPLLITIEKK